VANPIPKTNIRLGSVVLLSALLTSCQQQDGTSSDAKSLTERSAENAKFTAERTELERQKAELERKAREAEMLAARRKEAEDLEQAVERAKIFIQGQARNVQRVAYPLSKLYDSKFESTRLEAREFVLSYTFEFRSYGFTLRTPWKFTFAADGTFKTCSSGKTPSAVNETFFLADSCLGVLRTIVTEEIQGAMAIGNSPYKGLLAEIDASLREVTARMLLEKYLRLKQTQQ